MRKIKLTYPILFVVEKKEKDIANLTIATSNVKKFPLRDEKSDFLLCSELKWWNN